jgi:hypothetical protein
VAFKACSSVEAASVITLATRSNFPVKKEASAQAMIARALSKRLTHS